MKPTIRIYADGSCAISGSQLLIIFASVSDVYSYFNGGFFRLKSSRWNILIHQGNIPLDK